MIMDADVKKDVIDLLTHMDDLHLPRKVPVLPWFWIEQATNMTSSNYDIDVKIRPQ